MLCALSHTPSLALERAAAENAWGNNLFLPFAIARANLDAIIKDACVANAGLGVNIAVSLIGGIRFIVASVPDGAQKQLLAQFTVATYGVLRYDLVLSVTGRELLRTDWAGFLATYATSAHAVDSHKSTGRGNFAAAEACRPYPSKSNDRSSTSIRVCSRSRWRYSNRFRYAFHR